MNFQSLAAFAAFSAGLAHELDKAKRGALEKGCQILEKEAKDVMGTDGYGWPALSPLTQKTQPGMLLEKGDLRDSIHHTVVSGSEAHVGSDSDNAVWQELGTTKLVGSIPPRSFLMGAAIAKRDEVGKAIGEHFLPILNHP